MYEFFFFFFSSRRRHTRSLRDWSSDVCSSDLGGHPAEQRLLVDLADGEAVVLIGGQGEVGPAGPEQDAAALGPDRLDDRPGDLLPLAQGHAAEAHVHRWRAGVQERLQLV